MLSFAITDKHEKSISHHQAIDLVEKIPQTTMNVADMLSSHLAEQKAENREILKIILSSICFLARQGLAFGGRFKAADGSDVSGEVDSNLFQLLKTRAEDNPKLFKWMDKRRDKFMSPDIQNEMLGIMAQFIQREISRDTTGKWFTIMVDETTDLTNTEQMVCYVASNLDVHEEFIGLYSLESTSAASILATINDILLRMNLKIENCRGQCYDGAIAACLGRMWVLLRR